MRSLILGFLLAWALPQSGLAGPGVASPFPWETDKSEKAIAWAQSNQYPFPTPFKRPPHDRYDKLPGHGPYVALTFDDGPRPWTNTLLDELAKRQIKATFFVVGQEAVNYPSILKRMVAEGHEIANHTWTHDLHMDRKPLPFVRRELQMAHDLIVKVTGVVPKVMRPPGGNFSWEQTHWMASEFGYTDIRWSVDPGDAALPRPSMATFQRRIMNQVHEGAIILSHDLQKATVEAMPGTLDQLLKKEYQFLTVSELLALDEPDAALMILPVELEEPETVDPNGPEEEPSPRAPSAR